MKFRTATRVALALSAVVVLGASGCNDGGPSSKVFVKNGTSRRLRVAVLPFDNVSRDQDAGRVMTNTVMTYLLSTGAFDVVEPGVVYAAMGSENVRLTEGVTAENLAKLQPKLNADAYIVGMVEEYGEVRIGADTYPSVSFSSRLVDARTANILWAATISKTGADKVKMFDLGRVSSLGKLSKQAVSAMAVSLAGSRKQIMTSLDISPVDASKVPPATTSSVPRPETTIAAVPPPTPAPVTPTTAAPPVTPEPVAVTPAATETPAAVQNARFMDESATYGEKELTALLADVDQAKVSEVNYKKHYHATVEAKYGSDKAGKAVEVRLVDYKKPTVSEKFLQEYNPGAKSTTFESLPAFTGVSTFGYYHLDVAAGRFGLYLRGPKGNKDDIDALGKSLVARMK